MTNLLKYLAEADLFTKMFIMVSVVGLGYVQYHLWGMKFRIFSIPILLILFGLFLNKMTVYHPLVHLCVYMIPSFIVAIVFQKMYPYQQKILQDPLNLTYRMEKGILRINPFAGVCILGVPKSGKTSSFVKPTIAEMAEKGYCGAIYDYKQFDLTKCAYHHFMNHPQVAFKMVNFFDLNHTYRINPVSPEIIKHPAYAIEASHVFITNMIGTSKGQNIKMDPYWIESAMGLLAGILWRLKEDYPVYCDLPHAITILIRKRNDELTEFLEKNDQSVLLAASYFKSLWSDKQLAGIVGTLANLLSKVALPEIFYVLSANEVNLTLNDPKHPTLLCLSTIQQLEKTYAPALALIISMCLKLMNQEGRLHSAIVLDEAPTLIIPEFDRIPATARSNRIATFFIAQDMVQSEDGYGRIGRDKILATLATHIYGKVMDPETAERYSKMFGTVEKYYTSNSRKAMAWSNSSYTDSIREVKKFKPERFQHLDTGEFIGIIAEGNRKEVQGKFRCYEDKDVTLPNIRDVTDKEVKDNFNKIIMETKKLT